MITAHRCLRAGLAAGLVAWAWSAVAQVPPPEVLTAGEDWYVAALRELGAPGVVAAVVIWLTRSVSGWTPTFRIIHVQSTPDEGDS